MGHLCWQDKECTNKALQHDIWLGQTVTTLSDAGPVSLLKSDCLHLNSFVGLPYNHSGLLILNTGAIGTLTSHRTYCGVSLAALRKSTKSNGSIRDVTEYRLS